MTQTPITDLTSALRRIAQLEAQVAEEQGWVEMLRDERDELLRQRNAALTRVESLQAELGEAYPRWTHINRKSSVYREYGRGRIQTAVPLTEGTEVVIYRSEKEGRFWVRPTSEFEDGRFRPLAEGDTK